MLGTLQRVWKGRERRAVRESVGGVWSVVSATKRKVPGRICWKMEYCVSQYVG